MASPLLPRTTTVRHAAILAGELTPTAWMAAERRLDQRRASQRQWAKTDAAEHCPA